MTFLINLKIMKTKKRIIQELKELQILNLNSKITFNNDFQLIFLLIFITFFFFNFFITKLLNFINFILFL